MPAWITSLLREETPLPMPPVASATITSWPASAASRAIARPTTPAPMTRTCMDSPPGWAGLTRASISFVSKKQDGGGRDKPGDDGIHPGGISAFWGNLYCLRQLLVGYMPELTN